MGRFQPYADKPHMSFTYYEVPVEILEDREELTAWARRSVAAAMAIGAKKKTKKKKKKKKKKLKAHRSKKTRR
jgi:hypothetical protein